MRKLMTVVAAIGLVLIPLASARAQTTGLRDPFDPLLTAETQGGTTTGAPTGTGTDVDDPTAPDDPGTAPTDDGLPSTGADPMNWLAASYVLVTTGAALVVAARLLRPARRRLQT